MATFQNVSKYYGAQVVLNGASFQIYSDTKLGLIGPNGCGKTTILRILLGHEPPTSGLASLTSGTRVGYVPQHVEYDEGETVMDHLLADHARVAEELRAQEDRLAAATGDAVQKAMRAYQRARDVFERTGGDHFPERARAMLDALGLGDRCEQLIGSLSGGERNILSLTHALLAEPDLLVLDEPANHLDYLGVAWLEDFLSKFRGAVLVVSHNRYLLDRVVGGILQLQNGKIDAYTGNYSEYRATRLRELMAQQREYEANQKRLAKLEALVLKMQNIAQGHDDTTWGKRLKARRTQLERARAEAVEKPQLEEDSIKARFTAEASQADIALDMRGYTKSYGDLSLFEGADLQISCGERVALVGVNGCGKTSLLRDVVERGSWENPVIRVGPTMTIGYGAQNQEILNHEGTVLDEIMNIDYTSYGTARSLLARFLFDDDDMKKKISSLSGGERNRLQLARLMLQKPNFLILDEPTNHLDIPAREAIEEALSDYEGTLLVVSHDSYFLDKIVTRVVEARDRKLVSYPGDFSTFRYVSGQLFEKATGRISTRRKEREKASDSKRISKNRLAQLEISIERGEARKAELEKLVIEAYSRNDYVEGKRLSEELKKVAELLESHYEKWFAANE
ncbi:MAG TPA: ABC-F family ATP-binding cassette domain-containing protein [Candidatus Brocadiia bacterium]|nr:ABC-F family ATP-binding cassette domain-containing protein [Candidatus Brocadiia bacterium]